MNQKPAEVVTPQQLLGRRTAEMGAGSLSDERDLRPLASRRSSRDTAVEEPAETPNQPPRVSRIPVPTRSATTPQPSVGRSVEAGLPQPTTRPAPTTMAAEPSTKVEASLPAGSVSVPTQLVATPSSEKAAEQQTSLPVLPPLPPRSQDDSGASDVHPEVRLPTPTITNIDGSSSDVSKTTAERPAETKRANPRPSLPSPQSSSSDERMRMESPRIQVVLKGPSDLPVGQPADYHVVVRNDDRIDLQGLILRLDLPPGVAVRALQPSRGAFDVEKASDGATLLTWSFESLGAGKEATAPLQIVAHDARNFAVAMEWTLVPLVASTDVRVRTPRLELALDGPSEVDFGEVNTYRVRLRNAGNAVARDVSVKLSAPPYGTSESKVGDIPAGGEEVIDVELTFQQKGNLHLDAQATAVGGLGSQAGVDVLVRQPELTAEIAAPRIVYHGNPTKYSIRLHNVGDAPAKGLSAVLDLPTGAQAVAVPDGANLNGQQLRWTLPTIVPGQSKQVEVTIRLASEGENQVHFQCSNEAGTSASSTSATLVQAVSDLKLLVSDPVAPAPVASEVVYELELTNRGSKEATNVKVIAQFSEGIEPTRGEGHPARIVPGQVFFEPLPSVAAGETIKLKVFAEASSGGMHRFRAEVRADEADVRLVQEESTQFLDPETRIAAPATGSVIR